MKFVIIGDVHGRDYWMDFVQENKGAHFVFLGDYVDPYDEDISNLDALVNLQMIVNYKKKHQNNVTLLIGNHDAQYLFYPKFATGVLMNNEKIIETIRFFRKNKQYFQFAYQKGDNLFTHAGVSHYWYRHYEDLFYYYGLEKDKSNFADCLNKMGDDNRWRESLMDISSLRGGSEPFGGPNWADKKELFDAGVNGLHQFVGHNMMPNVWTTGTKNASITFCDVQQTRKKCLIKNL
jgi:predicted MPP superfamily phosphohydrolase